MSSENSEKPLRFGIMCNGTSFAAWEAKVIQHLIDSGLAAPALLIVDSGGESEIQLSNRFKKLKKLGNIFWYLYSYFLVRPKSKMLATTDMANELAQVKQIDCKVTLKGKFSQYFAKEDLELIRNHNLDFILRFGFNIIRGEIHKVTRYGVWSFHHDDEHKYRGGPACFWEIYYRDPVNGAILQRLNDRLDGGIVLKKGYFKTIDTSFAANRDFVYSESADWPVQVCRDIHNEVAHYLTAEPSSSVAPIYYIPGNLQMIRFWLTLLENKLLRAFKGLFYYWQWNIGIIDAPIQELLHRPKEVKVQWLPQPAWNRFYADPFAVNQNGELVILFEDLDYRTDVGIISAYKTSNGQLQRHEDRLELPCHLSYPYLFGHKGKTYCIPETAGLNEVVLYQFEPSDLSFTRVKTLISNYAAFNSSVIEYEGTWWLFATSKEDGPNHKLMIWHAPELEGPWQPHANNPVKVDVSGSRPAGTPFLHEGQLYRPAQDSSRNYGGRTVIQRVTRLTPVEFAETPVSYLEPFPDYPKGLHTVAAAGGKVVVDGVQHKFIGGNKHMIGYKLKKLRQKLLRR